MSISNKLNLDNNNWLSCKYSISVEIIYSDNTVRTLKNAQILGLYIEKDYDKDYLPVIMIDLSISSLDENKVDDDTIFHVTIKQFYVEGGDINNERKSLKTFIDEKFHRIDYGTQPDVSEKFEKKIRASDGLDDDSLASYDLTSSVTYVLVKKSDLIMTKVLTNDVLVNCTMHDVICYLLTVAGCGKKVLMSSLTNTTNYSELLLEPRTFLEQMIFLENEFGWHTEGTYIFIDYDIFYIVRKGSTPTVWLKNEPKKVCFCINSLESSDKDSSGIIIQDNIVYVNTDDENYKMVDASIVEDQISGSNLILVNTTTGDSTTIESGTNTMSNSGTYVSKMYHGHNPYTIEQFKRMRKENDHIWDIVCNNSDIGFYTPQRLFTFLSDVTKINDALKGTYRISSMKSSFIKNGEIFDTSSTVRVKRVSET
jgi:hypothetical protein